MKGERADKASMPPYTEKSALRFRVYASLPQPIRVTCIESLHFYIWVCITALPKQVGPRRNFKHPLSLEKRALIITYTTLGVPYYKYSIIYPQSPSLIIKAPLLHPNHV